MQAHERVNLISQVHTCNPFGCGLQVERFSSVVFDAFALPDARQMEQHFQEYLNGAKVALLNERGAVDSVLNTLTTQLRVNWSEQARDPVEAALPAEVTRLWEALDAAEGRFQANLGMHSAPHERVAAAHRSRYMFTMKSGLLV